MWVSRLDPGRMLRALASDSGPPLFYLLEKPFVAAAEVSGIGDAFARLLPWAATLFLALAARALPGARSRALFVGLLATSPLLTLYAAEARAYAPLALAGLALALAARRGEGRGRIVATAAVAGAALFLHYLAGILVAAVVVASFAAGRRRAALAAAAAALPFLLWIPTLARQPAAATAWMREPALASAVGMLSGLGGAGRIPSPFGPPLPAALAVLGAVAATAAAATSVRAIRAGRAAEAAFPLAVTGLFLAILLLASLVRPVAFAGRSELAVLPLFLWGIAAAAGADRAAFRAAVAVLAVGAVATVLLLARARPAEPGAAVLARRTAALAQPRDLVAAAGSFYLPARLASDRGVLRAPLVAFPAGLADHPGWFAASPPTPADDRALLARLERAPAGARVFFLVHPFLVSAELSRALAVRGAARLATAPEGALFVWTARPGAPASAE